MKTYEFRSRDKDGNVTFKTIELPDDAALMIGRDKHDREIYEGDGIFTPDNFYVETATVGIKPFIERCSLAQDALERQKILKQFGHKEYFAGDPTKENMPPPVWFKYWGEPSDEWRKFHGIKKPVLLRFGGIEFYCKGGV